MYYIENEFTRLSFDANGNLMEMRNRKSNRNWVQSHHIFRLILERPGLLEFEVFPSGKCRIDITDEHARLSFEEMVDEDGKRYQILTTVTTTLEGENVRWEIEVENRMKDMVVRETHCPLISIDEELGSPALISPENISTRYEDLHQTLSRSFTGYMAPDHKYIRKTETYPGMSLSMNFSGIDFGLSKFIKRILLFSFRIAEKLSFNF